MVQLVEVKDEYGKASDSPKDVVKEFLKTDMKEAMFDESEIGGSDKDVNSWLARARVYIKYHKLDYMVDVSRRKPNVYLRRVDKEEVEENDDSGHTTRPDKVDGESATV